MRRLRRLLLVGAGLALAGTVAPPLERPAAAADDGVRFQATRVMVAEGDTRVTLNVVRRTTAALTEAKVAFATEDYDAAAGADYIDTRGTIVLGVGQTTATIDVLLVDDRLPEGTERFHVLLVDPEHSGWVIDRSWVDVSDNDQWRDQPFGASSSNRSVTGSGGSAGAGTSGSAVTTPARPTQRATVHRSTSGRAAQATSAANRRTSRATPFKLSRPVPAEPIDAEPSPLTPVAALALVAAVLLACVSARVWHHWRMSPAAD